MSKPYVLLTTIAIALLFGTLFFGADFGMIGSIAILAIALIWSFVRSGKDNAPPVIRMEAITLTAAILVSAIIVIGLNRLSL